MKDVFCFYPFSLYFHLHLIPTNQNIMMKDRFVVFATHQYEYLKAELLQADIFSDGKIERNMFPDGEKYYRILDNVQNKDVILIGGTISDSDTLELYDIACGLVAYGVRKLNLVIPFFGYSTMERAIKSQEIVTAKNRAKLLSSISAAYFGNRVMMIDLHVSGIQFYFEETLRTLHLYAKDIITQAAQDLGGNDFVLASTDSGRAKWIESLARDLGVDVAFVYKRRLSGSDTVVTGINADVSEKTVVIYDDMIRTGGSLVRAAKAYKDGGARKIFAVATHGVFPHQALDKIKNSGLFEKLIVTNTHPNARRHVSQFVEVRSVAPLLEQTFRSLAQGELL